MSYAILVQHAQNLLKCIASELESEYGLSSMAPSIYDTAWIAMVPDKSGEGWLFPESFSYLLKTQNSEGGWDPLDQASRTTKYPDSLSLPDTIIHSLAALLAICQHVRFPVRTGVHLPSDCVSRIFRAKAYLDSKLSLLTLDGVTHFGFELLVPVLLQLLEKEGIEFTFPAREELLERYQSTPDTDVSWLYDGPCQVPLFSLEAFIGKVEVERLGHLVTKAGISGSPASTAAFLTHSPTWNEQAEAYLEHVVMQGQGRGDGSVGGVFPLELFEPCWVLTALLENGFTADNLGPEAVESITRLIHEHLQNGAIGANHLYFPDADDTSRALTTVNLQGYQISPAGIIDRFEVEDHFATFDAQMPKRVTSVSVNGNVLTSLLRSPDPVQFIPQIEKIVRFMKDQWSSAGKFIDHWSLSEYYGLMHVVQSLALVITFYDQGSLTGISDDIIQEIIPSCLRDALEYLLKNQHEDGTWGDIHCAEETAYAVVALAKLGSHPTLFHEHLFPIDLAIARGKQFLLETWVPGNKNPDRVWTGKVLHGISHVGEAYILAALKVNRVNLAGARGLHVH